MADEIPQGEWVELPEDKLKDLDLPEDAAAEVKGGAVDMFLKLDGRSAFLKYGSKVLQGTLDDTSSISSFNFKKI